jgi:hypothetical protein
MITMAKSAGMIIIRRRGPSVVSTVIDLDPQPEAATPAQCRPLTDQALLRPRGSGMGTSARASTEISKGDQCDDSKYERSVLVG